MKLFFNAFLFSIHSMQYSKQLYLAGLLFSLHNTEELIGMCRFVLPTETYPIGALWEQSQYFPIIAITIIAWICIIWIANRKQELAQRNLLTVLVAVFLINAFFPHILAGIFLKSYFPGVVSAVFIYLPYSIWMLPGLYKSYASGRDFFRISIVGVLVTGLLTVVLQLMNFLVF